MYASEETIRLATRRKQPKKIIAELERRGIPFEVAWDGHPVVLESALAGRGSGNLSKKRGPNVSALRKRLGRPDGTT